MAFTCVGKVRVDLYPDVRYLSAGASMMRPFDVSGSQLLVYLGLDHCGLVDLQLPNLPNLRILDVSHNRLDFISMAQLSNLPVLRDLKIAGNPLSQPFISSQQSVLFNTLSTLEPSLLWTRGLSRSQWTSPTKPSTQGNEGFSTAERTDAVTQYPMLLALDLSFVQLSELNVSSFSFFRQLRVLNLSHTGVQRVTKQSFRSQSHLSVLDLRGCPISQFPRGLYEGLNDLQLVFADSYMLCCPAVLPTGFTNHNCKAPKDVISSCDRLLASNTVRALLSVFAAMAVTGNLATVTVRGFWVKHGTSGINVFTVHLALSNLTAGLYVSLLLIVDRIHEGNFLWVESAWRHSPLCTLAGFLFLLSTETSVVIIFLLTVDRLASGNRNSHRGDRCHNTPVCVCWRSFSPRSAHMAAGFAWAVGLVLAALPSLLGGSLMQEFYGATSICIPLPLPSDRLYGHSYCHGVLVILNTTLLFFVLVGQTVVYLSKPSTIKVILNRTENSREADIACRYIPIGVTHFIYYFLLTLLTRLISLTSLISEEVTVTMVIVLLTLSPALTPLLYGYSVMKERRRHVLQGRLLKTLVASSRAKQLYK